MNKNLIRNIIIVFCVLLILIIGILITRTNGKHKDKVNEENNKKNEEEIGYTSDKIDYQANEELKREFNVSTMLNLKDIIENYINVVVSGDMEVVQELTDTTYDGSAAVLGNSETRFKINDIYSSQNNFQEIFFIEGEYIIVENQVVSVEKGFFKITSDFENNTYIIKPVTQDGYNAKQAITEEYTAIEKGNYNAYETTSLDTKAYVNRFFEEFMYYAKNAPQYAYEELLDSNYRLAKFSDVNSFITYINNFNFEVSSVNSSKYDGYTEYKIFDAENKEIILKEFANFEYTIALDNYTIASKQDLEKFENLSEEEKVAYCVKSFLKMLNSEDYESAYAVLPKGYKNTNFPTLQSFEEYVKANFYENNIFYEATVTQQDGVYVATATIKAGVSTKAQKQEKVFYVQLNGNMSYVLSFQY